MAGQTAVVAGCASLIICQGGSTMHDLIPAQKKKLTVMEKHPTVTFTLTAHSNGIFATIYESP